MRAYYRILSILACAALAFHAAGCQPPPAASSSPESGSSVSAEEPPAGDSIGVFTNVRDFGAKGTGKTDDSAAIQAAIDSLGETGGTVYFPEGKYACHNIVVKPHVCLLAKPTWSYSDADKNGATVLMLNNPEARCLLDLSSAYGSTVEGLALDGRGLGVGIHGISVNREDAGDNENALRIQQCRVSGFSGDGVHLAVAWAITVRVNLLMANTGNGLYVKGWDVFILDNWLTANGKNGYYGFPNNNKGILLRGNRVEWNGEHGVFGPGMSSALIEQNQIDSNGASGLYLDNFKHVNVTGNFLFRNGRSTQEDLYSSNVYLENGRALVLSSNTFGAYTNDDGSAELRPRYGVTYYKVRQSVLSGNDLYQSAVTKPLNDRGGNEGLVIRDNIESLAGEDY